MIQIFSFSDFQGTQLMIGNNVFGGKDSFRRRTGRTKQLIIVCEAEECFYGTLARILRLLYHRMDSKPYVYKQFCDFDQKAEILKFSAGDLVQNSHSGTRCTKKNLVPESLCLTDVLNGKYDFRPNGPLDTWDA